MLANTGATDAQTYTVTSSNPDIAASIATGPFWNVGVSYTDPTNAANDFTGNLTFQLFQGLTPNTVSEISNLTNNGYYVNSGKFFSRIIVGIRRSRRLAELRTAPSPIRPSRLPTKTCNNWPLPARSTGDGQFGQGPTATPRSSSSRSRIQNSSLGYGFTIFGQLLTGVDTVNQMAAVP